MTISIGEKRNNMSGYRFILFEPGIDNEEYVLQCKNNAMATLLEIKTIIQYSGEGTEVQKKMVTDLENIIMDANRFLKIVNPDKYGGRPVRQSRVIRTG